MWIYWAALVWASPILFLLGWILCLSLASGSPRGLMIQAGFIYSTGGSLPARGCCSCGRRRNQGMVFHPAAGWPSLAASAGGGCSKSSKSRPPVPCLLLRPHNPSKEMPSRSGQVTCAPPLLGRAKQSQELRRTSFSREAAATPLCESSTCQAGRQQRVPSCAFELFLRLIDFLKKKKILRKTRKPQQFLHIEMMTEVSLNGSPRMYL